MGWVAPDYDPFVPPMLSLPAAIALLSRIGKLPCDRRSTPLSPGVTFPGMPYKLDTFRLGSSAGALGADSRLEHNSDASS